MYTLGPALRIPDVKNLGRDLALKVLRILWISRCNNVKILEKSRAKDGLLDHQDRGSTLTDVKSEDPAKMTHSISDFLRRLRA